MTKLAKILFFNQKKKNSKHFQKSLQDPLYEDNNKLFNLILNMQL